jgi:DNA-binding NarL/FixJ family response regulator
MAPGQAELSAGRAALDRGDWATARSLFAELVQREDDPDAHYGLARALEWEGSYGAAVRCYERAYSGYRERGETRIPALIAGRELSFLYAAVYGNAAVAGGWLARARTLVDEAGECVEAGWVELAEALFTGDPDAIETHARTASGIARRLDDPDLAFCALGYEGTGLVLRGRVAEGMRRVDEAALAATNGEVRDHVVVGEIYCKMLLCCELTLDVRRAQDWITTADAAGRAANGVQWISAVCRMHYGGILTAAGRWSEAEEQLSSSLRLHDSGMRAMRSGSAVRLADLRVRQGRLQEASALLRDNEFDGQAVLPLARLHLFRGEPDVADAVLRRALGTGVETVLDAPALALLAEVRAATGRMEEAQALHARLRLLAEESRLAHVQALSAQVAGVLRRATDQDGAVPCFEEALRGFTRAGLPWEAARCRLALARVLAGTGGAVAAAEARAALDVFRGLGARVDADEAATVLRDLGVRPPPVPSPRTDDGLTGRECEVLRLMVEGLSNQQIADRLFLSKRTVEHHVGRILAKLGVATRVEALAHALRSGLP